jgi:hypothetical protein
VVALVVRQEQKQLLEFMVAVALATQMQALLMLRVE